MSEPLPSLIISHLLRSEGFLRKSIPNIRPEYFRTGEPERVAFEMIKGYVDTYSEMPSHSALAIELTARTDLNQDLFNRTADLLGSCATDDSEVDHRWLLDRTEEFCKDRAMHIAISKAVEILDKRGEKGLSRGAIPKLMQDALAVTFDPHIGHDWLDDSDVRFDEYTRKTRRLPFDLREMNDITGGGLLPKTLNVVMAVSGAGKSLFMSHCASAHLVMGKNVLYITLELSEQMLGQRIDANLLGVQMDMLATLPRDVYQAKVRRVREKTTGRLVIKEYAVGTAGASHFRHLLQELRTKKGFVPDVVYVDYINICCPTGRSGDMNSYERVKVISEELRAIAVDHDLPLVSATQSNRGAYGSTTVGMENVSDSLGLPMTADLFLALISTEQLERMGQYKVAQLKSRYNDKGKKPYFFLGVDRPCMRLYDVDGSLEDDTVVPAANTSVPSIGGGRLDFTQFR